MSTYTIEYRTQTYCGEWEGWQERQTYDFEVIQAESDDEAIRVMIDQYYERGWFLPYEDEFYDEAKKILSNGEDWEITYWMELHDDEDNVIAETDHEGYIDSGCKMYGYDRGELWGETLGK